MNVVFLDYDGVVNTPMWDGEGKHCRFNFPEDNKVNNFQAVQWVSEFCQKYGYSIVVTSSWRLDENYKTCLINGGLREGIEILGRTPSVLNGNRGDEIQKYLNEHPDVENFVIFDDEDDMGILRDYLVKCETNFGFGISEMSCAESIHKRQEWKKENMVNALNVQLKDIELVLLPSVDEYSAWYQELCLNLVELQDRWWLRTPGCNSKAACFVDPDNRYLLFCETNVTNNCGIRPLFRIKGLADSKVKKVLVGNLFCTVVDETFALSDSIVCEHIFDANESDWDKCEINSFINSEEFFRLVGFSDEDLSTVANKRNKFADLGLKPTLLCEDEFYWCEELHEGLIPLLPKKKYGTMCDWVLKDSKKPGCRIACVFQDFDRVRHPMQARKVLLRDGHIFGIRPAFKGNVGSSKLGEKVTIGNLVCTIVGENLALSDSIVFKHHFDSFTNDWDKSELKIYMESNEFAESIGL